MVIVVTEDLKQFVGRKEAGVDAIWAKQVSFRKHTGCERNGNVTGQDFLQDLGLSLIRLYELWKTTEKTGFLRSSNGTDP